MPNICRIRTLGLAVTGPASINHKYPEWSKSLLKLPFKFKLTQSAHGTGGFVGMPYVLLADGIEVSKGILDDSATLDIEHEITTQEYQLKLANGRVYKIPVVAEHEPDSEDFYRSKGFLPSKSIESEVDYAKFILNQMNTNEDNKDE